MGACGSGGCEPLKGKAKGGRMYLKVLAARRGHRPLRRGGGSPRSGAQRNKCPWGTSGCALLAMTGARGNVTIVFGKGKGKRWKGGGGRGILTVLGDGAMGRRLPKEKEVML